MPDFTKTYPSIHRRVKMTVCRMQNTASLALRAKCTHTPTQTHKLNLADQYFLSVVWQSSLTPAERFKWLNNTARSKVEKRQYVEKKESLGNILEKCNMVGKIKVSIKKQTHNFIMWAIREINLFYQYDWPFSASQRLSNPTLHYQ